MIGDCLDADIQGAMNAGIDQVYVNHIGAECSLEPTYTVRSLNELQEIF
jgi:putative hydrolase of the HAD superfamily